MQTAGQFLAELVGRLWGFSEEDMDMVLSRADSLDLLELVMEVEETLGRFDE